MSVTDAVIDLTQNTTEPATIIDTNNSSNNTAYINPLSKYNTKHCLAPMIDLCDYSFLQLCTQYNTTYCYTQMYHSTDIVNDRMYLNDILQSYPVNCSIPIAIQICGNDIPTMIQCVQLLNIHNNHRFGAIDLNLGCPLRHARNNEYGAYMVQTLEQQQHTCNVVQQMSLHSILPITCKVRLLDNITDTIQFYVQLIQAGCKLLCIHARYIDIDKSVKQRRYGSADLHALRTITHELKQHIDVNVCNCIIIGNGNVRAYSDVVNNIEYTGVDGYMCAESILDNPAIYSSTHVPYQTLCRQYIEYVRNNQSKTVNMHTITTHVRRMMSPYVSNTTLLSVDLCNTISDLLQILQNHTTDISDDTIDIRRLQKRRHKQLRMQSGRLNSKERNRLKRKLATQYSK